MPTADVEKEVITALNKLTFDYGSSPTYTLTPLNNTISAHTKTKTDIDACAHTCSSHAFQLTGYLKAQISL
jgi:hypothetical protein